MAEGRTAAREFASPRVRDIQRGCGRACESAVTRGVAPWWRGRPPPGAGTCPRAAAREVDPAGSPRAREIAQCCGGRTRHPHGRDVPGAKAPRQASRIAPVRRHAIAPSSGSVPSASATEDVIVSAWTSNPASRKVGATSDRLRRVVAPVRRLVRRDNPRDHDRVPFASCGLTSSSINSDPRRCPTTA